MKAFIYAITLLLFTQICTAQRVYQIRADSVRIYNTCDTAELIIENRTKDTLGFLYNKGNGRTEFRKLHLKAVNGNSIAIAGQDTLLMSNVIKVSVDSMYLVGNTLTYHKTNGDTKSVILDLSSWGDTKYDLLSTNNKVIAAGTSVPWGQWTTNKLVGYDAYNGAGMPKLSAQAINTSGDTLFYNGLVYQAGSTGFDIAVNWNGEDVGPNGMFLRTKDDTKPAWSKWRELLFKDYADKTYGYRNAFNSTASGAGWYRIAVNGPLVLNSTTGGTATYGRFIITAAISGMYQTVEFIASTNYASQPLLKVISNTDYNNYPFAAIRMVRAGTFDGYAIEVLTTRTEALALTAVLLDNEQLAGWSPVNWTRITSLTGPGDGLPSGFTQTNISLNTGMTEGTTDITGSYWRYVRNAGLQTTGGFRQRSALGMVGNYTTDSTTKKIIWTIGDNNILTTNYTGIGYDYGNQVTGTNDHQITMGANGSMIHRFGLTSGALLGGPVKVNGTLTATGLITGTGITSTSGISASGAITTSTTMTATGTITGGTITSTGGMNASGAITGSTLTTTGTITAGGIITAPGFYQSSLRSLKKDITTFNGDALKLISGLKIVEFTYKDDKEELRHTGIIADESDAHFSTKEHNKFDTNSAVSITMKAVQELTEKLELLNKRIEELEKKIK